MSHYIVEMKDYFYGKREWGFTEIWICWEGSSGRKRLGNKNAKVLVFGGEKWDLGKGGEAETKADSQLHAASRKKGN